MGTSQAIATKQAQVAIPFVDLTSQYTAIRNEVGPAIERVLRNSDFILGQDVERLEEEFAAYCHVEYAVGLDSGTAALELILRAYEIGPGDEVITVANTFIATALAIIAVGATPVLVDIDPATYTMDVTKVAAAITARTKAIMPVHLYGHPADMDPLLEIAQAHNLVVIEDACQAHGARYKGHRAGALGDAAAFSFYPAKNLGAYGDGGMIVTRDAQVADAARMFRNYGQRQKYHHDVLGYNHRLDSLQAAVLRVKLPYLDEWNEARRRHAARYNQLLACDAITLPLEASWAESVYHLYVIRLENQIDRDALQSDLRGRGISTGIHYPVPVHLQKALRYLELEQGDFPVSEQIAGQILSLPMYPELQPEMIEYVAAAVLECVGK